MPEPRLMAVITALMLLAGTAPARAGYDVGQLRQIEQYILARDSGALWEYLVANPAIMEGDDALAQELRLFVAATERGQLNFYAARPVVPFLFMDLPTGSVSRIEPY